MRKSCGGWSLDDRERQVLTLRYGLAGEPPLTLKEIGLRIGVTREWVRKIELKATAKLVESTRCTAGVPDSKAALTSIDPPPAACLPGP